MKGKFLIFIILSLIIGLSSSYSQSREDIENCRKISREYASNLAQALDNEDFKSIPEILFLWEQSCKMNEPLFRARVLHLIYEGKKPDLLYDPREALQMAINYRIRVDLSEDEDPEALQEYYEIYPDIFGYVEPGGMFDQETHHWARYLLRNRERDSLSLAFLRLYAGNEVSFFKELRSGSVRQTLLGEAYYQKAEELIDLPDFKYGVQSGLWIPFNDLGVIGPHPELGFFLGIEGASLATNASFGFRFGRTSEEISITVRDTITQTRNYQGGQLGFEFTGKFLNMRQHTTGLSVGGGIDIIDLVDESLQEPSRLTYISPYISFSLDYRYTFENRTWMRLGAGYHLLYHKSKERMDSPLTGDALMIRLSFGFSNNERKYQNLERMEYFSD